MRITKTNSGFELDFIGRKCFKPPSCEPCPLFHKLKIEPELDNYKEILAVGEGPGQDERIKMKPFTGPSGTYLRAIEEDTGASEYGVGHTNIILCEGGKKLEFDDIDALWDTIDCCSSNLWDTVDKLKPKLIVPLGNYPKMVFLPDERRGIGSCAGLLYKGKPDVIPLHHPAHICRNPKMHESYWDEWNEVRLYFAEKPGPFTTKIGTEEDLNNLMELDTPFIDFETTSYYPWDTGKIYARGKKYQMGDIICMAVSVDGLNSFVFSKAFFVEHLSKFKELFESKGVDCQNGQFDILFLKKYGIHPKLKDDTMWLSYSLDESPSHGLKRLSRRYLGLEDWSKELEKYPKRFASYAYIPEKVLYPYCGMDTCSGALLKPILKSKQDNDDKRLYENLLMPCANMFLDLNDFGIRVNVKRVMELKNQWMKERFEISQELLRDFSLPLVTPYEVSDKLQELGVVDYDAVTVKANLIKLRNESLEQGNEDGAKFCNLVMGYRDLSKAIDTQLLDVARSVSEMDCRVHPEVKSKKIMDATALITGRLVYSNPSFTNFPKVTRLARDLRSCFISDLGKKWGHRDEKQFEYRVYTAIMNDPGFKEIFRNPDKIWGDPHAVFTIRYFRGNVERYLREQRRRDIRGIMKTVGFGRVYGRGHDTVASQLDISVGEAKELMAFIDETIITLPDYHKWVESSLMGNQVLINPLGRKRRFPLITEENYHDCLLQAYNFPIQSTANDLNLMGMLAMYNSEYYKKGLLQPFFPIHDAIEYQVDENHEDEIEEWLSETLARIPATVLNVTDLEFKTDHGSGHNWAEASMGVDHE